MAKRRALLFAAILLAQVQPSPGPKTPADLHRLPVPPVPSSLPSLGPQPNFIPPPPVPGQFSPPPIPIPGAVNGNGIIGPGLPPGIAAPPLPSGRR